MYNRIPRLLLILSLLALAPLASSDVRVRHALAAGPICNVNAAGGATYTTIQAAINDSGCTTVNVAAGIYIEALTIARSLTIQGAGASGTIIDGGGINRVVHIDSGVVTLAGVTVRNGHPTVGDGGGIENYGTLTLSSSAVISNTATGDSIASFGDGGGIFNSGTLIVSNSTIMSNTTEFSGGTPSYRSAGIYSAGALTVISSSVRGNIGSGVQSIGALTITGSTVRGNIGNGIDTSNNATLANTTVSGNQQINGLAGTGVVAGTAGPPITVSLTNVTVSGNAGGGIGAGGSVTMLITNTSIISNSSSFGSPGGISNNSAIQIKNTVIAHNGASNCFNSGTWVSNGHNLSSDFTCEFNDPTDKPNVDPKVGPLANNGGPTETHALLPTSPAVDGGNNVGCPPTDQRGITRPVDGDQNGTATCDIGAYEAQPQLAILSISPTSATVGGSGFTLTIDGTLFVNGSLIQWNGAALPTTFVSSKRLTAQVGADRLASGGFVPVRVVNPNNSTSNSVMFAVNNRIPALASVIPGLVATGGPTFTLTLNGANFARTSVVKWNGESRPTTFVSSTRLTAQIGAADIALASQANVTVINPAPGGGSSNEATVDVGISYVGSKGGGVPTVAVSGSLAYIGEGSELTILNVSNPAAPVRLGGFTTREAVQDIEVVGSRAYVAAEHDGLLIFDVSTPTTPKLLGSYNTPGHAYDVQVVGNTAYVAAEQGGLQIIDVGNPASPRLLGHYNVTAYDLSVANNVVYIAAGNNFETLISVDVSDPAHPTVRDQFYGSPFVGATRGVQVVGNLAYATNSHWLQIVDVTSPVNGPPNAYSSYDLGTTVKDVLVLGQRAYVTSTDGKLFILDVSDWQNPQLKSTYVTGGSSWDVRVVGDRAFVADGVGGLLILNVGNPNAPTKLGKYATWSAYNQAIVGNRAYIAGGVTGLHIVDVSNPASPARLGAFATSGFAADVQVAGNLAFIANQGIWNGSAYIGGGLQIVNVGAPTAPKLVGSYTVEYASSVAVVGDRAYLAASDGLYILNVSDPAHPALLGKFATSSLRFFWKVRLVGGRAYTIADMNPDVGLAIIDVSNAAAPKLLGSYISVTGRATDVQIAGGQAYLTERLGALHVLNVNDPAHVTELGAYGNDYASFSAVQVVGSLAFIAASEENAGDLTIVDVSNPAKLKLVGERHLPWHALGVQVVGGLVYLSEEQGGLQVLRFPASSRVFLPVMRR